MTDIRTAVVLDLNGNLARRAREFGNSLNRLGDRGQHSMGRFRRATDIAGRGLDRLGNRYTALFTGVAAIATARGVIRLEARLERLGTQANLTTEQVRGLQDEIFAVAQEEDIRVNPDEILAAIESIVEKTGDLDFARNNIRNIGLAIQGTGATGKDVGELAAEFQKMGLVIENDVLRAFDVLNVQGKEGAFTLQNLAALGPRVITAYTALGRSGLPALREIGAALQVIRQGTGSPEMAATAFEALLRTMSDPRKLKMLQRGGIQVFDPEALKENREVLRPINEIMVEIIKNLNGRRTLIGSIFDAEAVRAFNASLQEFSKDGNLESLARFYNVQSDGSQLLKDSARNAQTAAAALTNLGTAWDKFADANLAEPIADLADALNSLDPETVQNWLQAAKILALAGGAAVLGKKAWDLGKRFRRSGAGALGGLAGAAVDGVTPVYVVNMPGSGFGRRRGMAGGAAARRSAGRRVTRSGLSLLRRAPTLRTIGALGAGAAGTAGALVGGAGLAGAGIGTLIYKATDETTFADSLGGTIATILAKAGNDEAQRALDTRFGLNGEVVVTVNSEGRARVDRVVSRTPGVDITARMGRMMELP